MIILNGQVGANSFLIASRRSSSFYKLDFYAHFAFYKQQFSLLELLGMLTCSVSMSSSQTSMHLL